MWSHGHWKGITNIVKNQMFTKFDNLFEMLQRQNYQKHKWKETNNPNRPIIIKQIELTINHLPNKKATKLIVSLINSAKYLREKYSNFLECFFRN